MDISDISDISANILIQNIDKQKIEQNLWNVRKKTLRNEIRSIIDILKLFCWKNCIVVNFVSIHLLWS